MSIEKKKCVKCDIVLKMLKEPCPLKKTALRPLRKFQYRQNNKLASLFHIRINKFKLLTL